MVVWSAPLWSMTIALPRSGFGWRVEAIHELDEHFLEAGLVVVGVVPDECDHLAVTEGGRPSPDIDLDNDWMEVSIHRPPYLEHGVCTNRHCVKGGGLEPFATF